MKRISLIFILTISIVAFFLYNKFNYEKTLNEINNIVLEMFGGESYKFSLDKLYVRLPRDKDRNIFNLNKYKRLEDFEYLINYLKKSFMYWDYLNEKENISKKVKHTKKLIKYAKNDLEYFYIIKNFILSLDNLGHISLISSFRQFQDYKSNFTDVEYKKEWFNKFNNNLSNKNYLKLKYIYDSDNLSNLNFYYLEDNLITKKLLYDTCYIRIKSFDRNYLNQDKIKINNLYKDLNNFKNLVIDLRGNTGGTTNYTYYLINQLLNEDKSVKFNFLYKNSRENISYIQSLIKSGIFYGSKEDINKEIEVPIKYMKDENIKGTIFNFELKDKYEDILDLKKYKFNGKIYILTDKLNYSAAEFFIYVSKKLKFATIVGNKTLGDGVAFEPSFFTLPNSGLIIRYSLLYGLNPDGSSNGIYGTKPDIDVGNKDALEVVMELIKKDA